MRFYERPKTRAEAGEWIARAQRFYEDHGFGTWRIDLRATGEFAGYCGIRPYSLDEVDEIEIGWHTTKTIWRQGIATEAAMAARDLAFGRFGLPRLVAVIHPQHAASRRVAEKIGMRAERTTTLENEYPAVVYSLHRCSTRP
jgi:RimJ/RimL family protein N-acetyltransferase